MLVAMFVVGRMLIAAVCVGLLVYTDDYATRLWIGGGILAIGAPAVYVATRLNAKIGFDEGQYSAKADLLVKHCEIQNSKRG